MTRFRLSAAAAADLEGIKAFSTERWGHARAKRYLSDLRDRLRWLAAAPRRGRACPDLLDGVHSYPQASHVICYRIAKKEIEIIRVLHRRMDPLRHLATK